MDWVEVESGRLLETSNDDSALCCSLFDIGVRQDTGGSEVDNGDEDDDQIESRTLRNKSAFVLVFEGLQFVKTEHGSSQIRDGRMIEVQIVAQKR